MSPRSLRAWLAAALCAWLVQLPFEARAELRFAVRPFEGPNAAGVHKAVVQACTSAQHVEVIDNARLEGAAAALHVDLDTDEGRAAVARELGIVAFMDGRVQRHGKQLVFVLETYRGRGGEKVGEGRVHARSAPKLAVLARQRLAATLKKLKRAREPEQAEPSESEPVQEPPLPPADLTITEAELERDRRAKAVADADSDSDPDSDPDRDPDSESDSDSDSDARAVAPDEAEPESEGAVASAFELGASLAAISRKLTYRDAQTELPEYDVAPSPMARIALRWYPAAHFDGDGIAKNLGLDAHGELMLPVTAKDGDSRYQTEHHELRVGARLRMPIGRSELGLGAGFGTSGMHISDSQYGGDPEIPSVTYRFARVGADARLAVGSELMVGVGVAYLHLLSYGEIADDRWFPHVGGGGVDAEVSAGYLLSRELTIQVALGLTRYFMSFHLEPDDRSVVVMRRIAGGAADQQLHLGIGAVLRL